MAARMKSLGIDRLSIGERLALVHEIWDSIASFPQKIPLTETQKRDFDRRIAELEANPENVFTWKEIKAHVRGQ